MTTRAGAYYVPVDETLERPKVRVLRALRFFESASLAELLDAVREHNDNTYQAFARALLQHSQGGFVVRLGTPPYRYRITSAGRRELERLLARGDINEGMLIP